MERSRVANHFSPKNEWTILTLVVLLQCLLSPANGAHRIRVSVWFCTTAAYSRIWGNIECVCKRNRKLVPAPDAPFEMTIHLHICRITTSQLIANTKCSFVQPAKMKTHRIETDFGLKIDRIVLTSNTNRWQPFCGPKTRHGFSRRPSPKMATTLWSPSRQIASDRPILTQTKSILIQTNPTHHVVCAANSLRLKPQFISLATWNGPDVAVQLSTVIVDFGFRGKATRTEPNRSTELPSVDSICVQR